MVKKQIEKSIQARGKALNRKWSLPTPRRLGGKNLTASELKEIAQVPDFEEQLMSARAGKIGYSKGVRSHAPVKPGHVSS